MISAYPDSGERIVGGVAGVSYYLATELARRPHIQIEVLNPFSPAQASSQFVLHGVQVTSWPIWNGSRFSRLMYTQRAREIAAFCDKKGADVVHMQGEPIFSRLVKTPQVATIHGIQERDTIFRGNAFIRARLWSRFLRWREQFYRKRLKDVIVISPYVKIAIGSGLRGRCWDVENPVRDDFFEIPRRPIPGRIYFGGTLNPRKNIDGMIRAFAIAKQKFSHAELRIGGHSMFPEYEQACRKLAHDLGVGTSVSFLGSLNIEQVKAELAAASFLALCSKQETAPLVIEEAMAAGVPILASRICGIPWMVEPSKTGVLVNPESVPEIAEGMCELLGRSDLSEIGKNCQLVAEKRFRVARVADQTIDVYRHIQAQA